MIVLVLYGIVLCGVSFWAARRSTADGFFVNSRSSKAWAVALSIVASCVGGSATIGMAGLAWQVGTPAFWWLGSGAAGLLVLTVFLARKVRQSKARTMPEILTTFIGAPSRPLAAVIIVVAWLAILAAQFSALAAILSPLLGLAAWGRTPVLLIGAAIIVAYAVMGGQSAVIKSDCVQYGVMISALLAALVYLYMGNPAVIAHVPLEIINEGLPLSRLSYFMCILGGSYVVCPMLFGRLLSAKDAYNARMGGLWAVLGLVFTAAVIVALGIACRAVVPAGTAPEAVLTTAIMGGLPPWLGALVLLGLFSAVISSADSCLITAATVCCNDILHRTDLASCRWVTLAIGLGGLLLALPHKGILALLLMANDIYVCGIVIPVFVGMVLHERYVFRPAIMALAIVAGGALGLSAALTENTVFSYAGMSSSLVLSLCALKRVVPITAFAKESL
ncbi:MAG: hypothetical protein RRY29_07460 [Desulfovibrionaceae bacterium]